MTASVFAQNADNTSERQMVDLITVYEQAQNYDSQFQTALFELEAAQQRVPLARSSFLPQIAFAGAAGINTLADDDDGPYRETTLSLSLNQSLFNRSNAKQLNQAELGVRQAEAQYAATGQTLILRVATAYFDVLRAQASVEFSQSELEAISRQREQAERRFDVGLVPITDVRSAQAQFDLAVAQEIAASNQLETAKEALLRVSGLDIDQLVPLADDLPLTPPDPTDIEAWVTLAKQQNLDLINAQIATEQSREQIALQRAARYPTLDLVGSAASNTTNQSGRTDTDIASLDLQLRVPILTGGRTNAQVAQARAELRAAEQRLRTQERTTLQQTRDGYRGVQASISRVQALRQALVSTQQSAEATEAGFRAGTRTSVEVLQALRDTFRALSDYSGARYDYIINTLNLKAAAGTLSEADILAINNFLAAPQE